MKVLIVGGDGTVGRQLPGPLRATGCDVTTTSRQPGAAMPLNLATGWQGDPGHVFGAMVIAAAITRRDTCDSDPDLARKVNVDAPVRLAAPMLARGGHVVFLSTHIVLGGARPFLPVDAPYAPCDTYSAQKAQAEQALSALPGAATGLTILRLTKVVSTDSGDRFHAWDAAIRAGQPITPFKDLVLAPIMAGYAAEQVADIIRTRRLGTVHLSGAAEHSYAEIALTLAPTMGWDTSLIHPVAGRAGNPIAAATPPHASLASHAPQRLADVVSAFAGALA